MGGHHQPVVAPVVDFGYEAVEQVHLCLGEEVLLGFLDDELRVGVNTALDEAPKAFDEYISTFDNNAPCFL